MVALTRDLDQERRTKGGGGEKGEIRRTRERERERERERVYTKYTVLDTNPRSILTSNGPVSDSNHRNAFRAECYISVHETFCHVDIPLCVHAIALRVSVCSCACASSGTWIINAYQVRIKRDSERNGR